MCEEIDFLHTAHCGDALPTLRGAELSRGLKVISVIRTGDQIRIRCRRRCTPIDELVAARAAARILGYRSTDPEPSKR